MVTFGVDAHKRTHTIVADDDDHGTPLGQTTDRHHRRGSIYGLVPVGRAGCGAERRDGRSKETARHPSRRLERDLLGAGEEMVRVRTRS